jgi:hypothetical protein
MNAFTRTWEPAPAVIDYVARHLGVDRHRACAVLRDALFATVRSRGPIAGANASEIASEFWRFAAIDPEGFAIDLSSMKKLSWFEVNAEDVLRIWPPAAAPEREAEPAKVVCKQPSDREIRAFLLMASEKANAARALKAAEDHFDCPLNREAFRAIWKDCKLGGKRGRPRVASGIPQASL